MGNFISNIFHKLFGKKQLRILMVGLDGAGKTTILYKLKLGQVIKTIPTIGFNVETLEYKNIVFTVWDVGGQDKLRRLWRHYYQNSHAIIFVVDSSDRDRVDEVANELRSMMMGEFDLQNCVLLIFANKQDMNGALTCEELTERLKLHEVSQKWYIQPTCAVKGDGLHEGFDWLCNEIVESPQN